MRDSKESTNSEKAEFVIWNGIVTYFLFEKKKKKNKDFKDHAI